MQNNKIRYIPIGQAERLADWVEERKALEKIEKRMTVIGIISVLVICVIFITLIITNIPKDDPYQAPEGAFNGLTWQEILELENEKAASKLIDAQVSRGGFDIREMEATAYTWTGNKTATGIWPEVGVVAVDPEVIPLGTHLYVEGYGPAIASDTGADIVGNRIDLYMDTEEECWEFGRRLVRVKVID